jgi:hypothetical protein
MDVNLFHPAFNIRSLDCGNNVSYIQGCLTNKDIPGNKSILNSIGQLHALTS